MAELKNHVLCATASMTSSQVNTPAVFVAAKNDGATLKSHKIFVAAKRNESELKIPRIFVSITEGTPIFSMNCDTCSVEKNNFAAYGDIDLKLVEKAGLLADASRKLVVAYDMYADSFAQISKPGEGIAFCMQADSMCCIQNSIDIDADICLNAVNRFSAYCDLLLEMKEKISITFCLDADTYVIYKPIFSIFSDVCRGARCRVSFFADTCMKKPYDTTFIPANTGKPPSPFVIPPQKAKHGMVSMRISLNELTLSDSFELATTYPLDVLDAISGKILDYQYSYAVGEVDWQDMTVTATGMYDVDRLLYMPMKYSAGSQQHKASYHAEKIAGALGKNLHIDIDDFTHSSTWVGNGQTYESIISSLFGWTSAIPHKQINAFLRASDNSFNVIQRGHERKTTDITDTHHTRPQYHRELVRTLWSGRSGNGGVYTAQNINIEPIPFSGTITFGNSMCTYASGYLVAEAANGNKSTYSYNGGTETGMYLVSKNTIHADGSHTTITYKYDTGASGVQILGEEKEVTYSKDGTKTQRLTVHAPLGNGFYGTSVYVDDEYQGSSISTGSPSGAASRYMRNEESITLGGARYSGGSNDADGDSLIDEANFPVEETEILKSLTAELRWLNRRIKETVSMDIYNYGHTLDFFEKIRFRGHDYFLVSNDITQTTRELKQSVVIVRWY